ncbi:hypothetical protein [Nocardioides exalbidus]|uniref:hypothetical protein n=1 Tax=Nocardioides exalbidus TaxID=402596 RepID=UPI00158752D8|nr:hypothetical protein [Nocardioides exalbidus]
MTFDSSPAGGATRYDGNLTVPATTNIGALGAGERGLAIRSGSTALTALVNQTITVRFSRAVSNLSFSIVDLDRDANFWDRVTCNPVPTSSNNRPTTVAGVGDAGLEIPGSGPFRYTGGTTGIDDTSNAGNVQLVYAGGASFTQLQLVYWNAGSPGPQGILLSDFTFTARGC